MVGPKKPKHSPKIRKSNTKKKKSGVTWAGWEKLILCANKGNYKIMKMKRYEMKPLKKGNFQKAR